MAITVTDFNVSYQLHSGFFKITDVQDYAPGASLSDLTGRLKITAPSGIVYDNLLGDADIELQTSRINSTDIGIPMLSSGTPEVGLYTFEYVVTDVSIPVTTATLVKTFNYSYSKPTATNEATVDCLSPNLKGEDTTNYLVNGLTPIDRESIASTVSADKEIRLSGEKSGWLKTGDKLDIRSGSNEGEYTVSSVDYDLVTNETVIVVLEALLDSTTEGTLVKRKSTIYFVSVPGVAPGVSYLKTVDTDTFYSQTQSFSYEAVVFYDYGSGFTISDSFYSHDSIDVDCDQNLCEIFCCINAVYSEYIKYKCVNPTLAKMALDRYLIVTSHLTSLRTALECGDSAAVTSLTTQIKDVAQCNSDCSCESGDPILITGLGGSGSVVVASTNNGIDVVSTVNGSITTYTLSLDDSIVNKLDTIEPNTTTSIISSNGTVDVTDNISGGNTEYDLSVDPGVQPIELMAFDVTIDNISIGSATFTVDNVVIQNESNFTDAVTVALENTIPSTNVQAFKIEDFQVAGSENDTYKAFVEVTYTKGLFSPMYQIPSSTTYDISSLVYAVPRISVKESGKIEFVLLGNYNEPFTIGNFAGYFSEVKLNIKIVE